MTFTELLNSYFKILNDAFLFDYYVFSQPWIYFTIIPVIMYFYFFMIKWVILTVPIWLPLNLIVVKLKNIFSTKDD